jgi:hypothetical protein
VARTLRRLAELPGSGPDWPARLLAEYGLLHLLATAHGRLGGAPQRPGRRHPVAGRLHHRPRRRLTRPGHRQVARPRRPRPAGRGDSPRGASGCAAARTRQFASLLLFAPNGIFRLYADAALTPGTQVHADLHFYPGQPPLRALVGMRRAAPEPAPAPAPAGDAAALLATWAAALAQDPWLTTWPALVAGTVMLTADHWHLVDHEGTALRSCPTSASGPCQPSRPAPGLVVSEWTPTACSPNGLAPQPGGPPLDGPGPGNGCGVRGPGGGGDGGAGAAAANERAGW